MSRAAAPLGIAEAWDLRAPERRLLVWCLVCVAPGFLMLWGSTSVGGGAIGLPDLLPLGLYALSLAAMHATLVIAGFRGDQRIPVAVAFLCGIGVLAQYRLGSFDAAGDVALDLALFPAGFGLMSLTAVSLMRGRYGILARALWIRIWAGVSIGLLALLLALGQRFRGGVYAAGLVTPSEILKVTVVLFLAAFIHHHAKALSDWGQALPVPPWRALLPLTGFWLVLAGLLVIQRDVGLFVVLSMALVTMLLAGTGRIGYLLFGGLGAAGLTALVLYRLPHGERRIGAWLDPFADPTGSGWQILQGLSGLYSGGLWGEGFGRGNPEYTPIAQSDFVYSVIGEELGLAGCAVLILFFLIPIVSGLIIAARASCDFGRLVAVGLVTVLATQTLLNIGGVTRFIPLTGIPLPFISHGGSSLLTSFLALGLILAISDGRPNPVAKEPAPRARKAPRRSADASGAETQLKPRSAPDRRARTPRTR